MFGFYDTCESVDFKGSRNEHWTHFPYLADIEDDEDSLTISTEVVIDYIDRGWIGDVTFNLKGYDLGVEWSSDQEYTAFQKVKLNDVLCIRRTFSKCKKETGVWKYTFLKY